MPIRMEKKKEHVKDKQMWKNICNKDDKGLFCYTTFKYSENICNLYKQRQLNKTYKELSIKIETKQPNKHEQKE